jgi:TonB family protein
MNNHRLELSANRLRRAGVRLMQMAALALIVMLAMPAMAADARTIKVRTAPHYPEIAKRMKVSGMVRLAVTVNADGKVTDVKPLSGNRILSGAAEEAIYNWKFEPGSGASTVEVAVNFAL